MVGHANVRPEELRSEPAIDFGRYPAFTKVKVQIGKGNGCRCGCTQSGKALLCLFVFGMVQEPRLDTLRLLYYIARNKLVRYLVSILFGG